MLTISDKSICFINSNKVWGGGEKWHYEFSLRLLEEGYKVFVVTNPGTDLYLKLQGTSIPVLPLRISNFSFINPLKILRLYQFFKKNKIRIAILGLSSDMKLGGIAAKLAGLGRILYRRGSAVPVKNTFLNNLLFKRVLTGVIVNSQEIKRALLQNNPKLIAQNKIHLLYNCIDIENISIHEPFEKFQNKGNGEIWLGNVGRLVDQKGQKYLIDLARMLKDKGIKFKLFIAGKGKLENLLREHAISLELEKEVVFLGFVPEICSFMQNIDIFLLASLHEGSANVLLEAMACSKPVVAFEVSSIGEIVVNNHTGFLAEFKNVGNLSECVLRLIEDEELRLRMGSNGNRRIKERFNVTRTMPELLSIIE